MTTKTVYSFDLGTGAYKGPVTLDDSDLSPLEPGKHLVPGDCLEEAPPATPEGTQAIAVNGTWTLQPKPVPQAPATPSLTDLKAQLTAQATARRWALETGGLELANGVRVATGTADQDRITSVIVHAELAGIASIDFKAAEGWIDLTLQELRAVATAVAKHVQACFSAERQHHEAIAALSTISAAGSYDITTGWPSSSVTFLTEA